MFSEQTWSPFSEKEWRRQVFSVSYLTNRREAWTRVDCDHWDRTAVPEGLVERLGRAVDSGRRGGRLGLVKGGIVGISGKHQIDTVLVWIFQRPVE